MFPQKLKDLLEGVGYKCLQGDDQVLVNDVVYDSRRVRPGCVFVCLIGSAVDSHQYAAICSCLWLAIRYRQSISVTKMK